MDANINRLRRDLSGLLGTFAEAYQEIIASKGTPPKVRLEAMRDLMDRLGLPAVKASLTKTMTSHWNPEDFDKAKADLLNRKQELIGELRRLEGMVEPDASDSKREKDPGGDEA